MDRRITPRSRAQIDPEHVPVPTRLPACAQSAGAHRQRDLHAADPAHGAAALLWVLESCASSARSAAGLEYSQHSPRAGLVDIPISSARSVMDETGSVLRCVLR